MREFDDTPTPHHFSDCRQAGWRLEARPAELVRNFCGPHDPYEFDCPTCGSTDVANDHYCEES